MTEKEKSGSSSRSNTEIDERRRLDVIPRVAPFILSVQALTVAAYAALYFQTGAWQMLAVGELTLLAGGAILMSVRERRKGSADSVIYWALVSAVIFLPATELFFSALTYMLAIGSFLLSIGLVSLMPSRRKTGWWVFVGLLGPGLTFFFNWLSPFTPWSRYHTAQSSVLFIFALAIIGLITLIFFWQLMQLYQRANTIRTRLLIASVLMVLLPAIAIGATSMIAGYFNGRDRIVHHLGSVTVLKEAEVDAWLRTLQDRLPTFLAGEDAARRVQIMLKEKPDSADYQEAHSKLLGRFQQNVKQSGYHIGRFEEIFLLNTEGRVILSTNPAQEGAIHARRAYFQEGLKESFVQPPYYVARLGKWMTSVSNPVKDQEGEILGVLVGLANLDTLTQLMQERAGLGKSGKTYLVSSGNVLLTESRFDPEASRVYSKGVNNAIQKQSGDDGLYDDYRGIAVIGVSRWLPDLQMVLMAEQDQAEAFSALYRSLGVNLGVALVAALTALVVMFFLTKGIITPLTNLTQTAEQIAGGNLNLEAHIERQDEVGELAKSFNSMTSQLRHLIANLEQRVIARTKRLEIAASLSERLTAILDFDQLLLEMVDRVKDSFGYYHVHVYIIDEDRRNLLMTAGAGEPGAQMKAKGHAIPVNASTSLVARAARSNQIVSVANVREEPDWLPNPLLPDTFSEMAVPIIVEGEALGVLDVQQDEIAGLDEGDANLLRSLANQVAVAIRNARLFERVESELAEARALQQQYVAQTWDRDRVLRRGVGRVQFNAGTSASLDEDAIAAARQYAVGHNELAIVPLKGRRGDKETGGQGEGEQNIQRALVAPITLHNTAIGDLQLHGFDPDRRWTENELALIEAVIDQVAQSAESMRLFEETQERASREHLIGGISDRMRRAPNMETLMKITVDELARALGSGRAFVRLGSSEQLKGMSK